MNTFALSINGTFVASSGAAASVRLSKRTGFPTGMPNFAHCPSQPFSSCAYSFCDLTQWRGRPHDDYIVRHT